MTGRTRLTSKYIVITFAQGIVESAGRGVWRGTRPAAGPVDAHSGHVLQRLFHSDIVGHYLSTEEEEKKKKKERLINKQVQVTRTRGVA